MVSPFIICVIVVPLNVVIVRLPYVWVIILTKGLICGRLFWGGERVLFLVLRGALDCLKMCF